MGFAPHNAFGGHFGFVKRGIDHMWPDLDFDQKIMYSKIMTENDRNFSWYLQKALLKAIILWAIIAFLTFSFTFNQQATVIR